MKVLEQYLNEKFAEIKNEKFDKGVEKLRVKYNYNIETVLDISNNNVVRLRESAILGICVKVDLLNYIGL